MTPDYYYYLNQSDTYKVDGTDDRSDFSETLVSTVAISAPGNLLVLQIGKPRPGEGQSLAQGHTAKKQTKPGEGSRCPDRPSAPTPPRPAHLCCGH